MKIDTTFDSKWLRAADIDEMADEETNTAVVTIERVELEEIGQDKQQKPVLYFKGIESGMVLNKTNANTIKDLYGNETDDWAGKRLGLFTTEVDFQGKQVLAIRVRLKAPKTSKAAPPVVEDEIPF
jgi:hypothetical protein